RCNTLIMSWILNSISPSIAQSVIFLECAVDIWDDLRERFSQSDLLQPNSFVNATANSFQGKGRGGYGSTSTVKGAVFSKKCAYCHRAGHTVDVCWGKHGYPLGHPRYPGHPRFNNHNSSSSANSVVVDEVVEGSCSHSGTSSSNPINLTQAQYQSLMALIQPMQLKSTSDSIGPHSPHQANLLHAIPNGPKRATDHITSSLDYFTSYSKIKPIKINLPN
ncbi:hypothetical protein glysoja_030571, partial [Glycine soja]